MMNFVEVNLTGIKGSAILALADWAEQRGVTLAFIKQAGRCKTASLKELFADTQKLHLVIKRVLLYSQRRSRLKILE
jgi:hypothetical protein